MIKTIAGIVLFNSDIERLKLVIESIIRQVDSVCLFDNGSENIEQIKAELCCNKKVSVIENEINAGIGYALNKIFEFAENNNFDYVLTLDHDTICPENLISAYYDCLKDSDGVICPNVIDKDIVNNKWYNQDANRNQIVDKCIQSGMLVKVSAWRNVQGFNEWMFVDFVDFDFCLKLNIYGYKIIKCNKVQIDHEFGKRYRPWYAPLFEWLFTVTHINSFKYFTYKNVFSPDRIFYTVRNNIAYIKTYKNYLSVKKERRELVGRIFKRILRGRHRFMIIKQTFKGIKAGRKYKPETYIQESQSRESV